MAFELVLMIVYRALALAVAAMMVWTMFRRTDWREQAFAVIVFIPFVLRAVGVK